MPRGLTLSGCLSGELVHPSTESGQGLVTRESGMPLTKEDPEYRRVVRCLVRFEAPWLPGGLTSVPVAQEARMVGISLGPPEMLWRLPAAQGRSVSAPAALWPQCTSSSSSVAAVYQLQQLFHLARNQASTRRVGELRGDRSPESEPRRGVSQGFYGLVLLGPCLADWSENWRSNRHRSEFYRSKCVGEGWLEVVDWLGAVWLDFA